MKVQSILIVDDNLPSRLAMEKVLQSRSYKTCSCESGEDAVLKLKEEFFGTLITDFQMHGMDGFELINEARRMHPEILTVLVSGLATEEMRVRINEQSVKGRILTKKGDTWN
jgi:CheY-like chemotaxis protein